MRLLRKVLLGVLVLAILGGVVFSIVIRNKTGIFIHEVVFAKTISEDEIESRKSGLIRIYEERIHGNWEPSATHAAVMLMKDSNRLHSIGVNTISVVTSYDFKSDGTFEVSDLNRVYSNIIKAKEAGFAVYLSINFLGDASKNLDQIGYEMDLDGFFEIAGTEALRWAEICEEFEVEYFNVHNEMNCFTLMNYYDEMDESSQIMAELIGEWHRDILPQVKELYSGVVVAKFCAAEFEHISPTGSLYEGYDIIGMTHQHFLKDLDDFREFTMERYQLAETMARLAGAEWMIGEGWFGFSSRYYGTEVNEAGNSLDGLQDEYYRISLEEYEGFSGQSPVGYIFHSWSMVGTKVRGRPAESVLREFFSR